MLVIASYISLLPCSAKAMIMLVPQLFQQFVDDSYEMTTKENLTL